MTLQQIWKELQETFHILAGKIKPALDFLETKGGEATLELAEQFLTDMFAGMPWKELTAKFIPLAESTGLSLLESEASIILNLAKANLDAKNLTNA